MCLSVCFNTVIMDDDDDDDDDDDAENEMIWFNMNKLFANCYRV